MENDIEECSICLEDISNNEITRLNCGHVIHTECLMLHVNYKITKNIDEINCPVCRHPLLTDHTVIELDSDQMETLEVQQLAPSLRIKYNIKKICIIVFFSCIICLICFMLFREN